MLKTKDSNDAVCAYYTWPDQTEYTAAQGNADPQAGPWFKATANMTISWNLTMDLCTAISVYVRIIICY